LPFSSDGFEIVNDFIDHVYFQSINSETNKINLGGKRGGVRNAEKHFESVQALLAAGILSKHAETYLGEKPHFVRAILFDKTPLNNWLVSWHQDKTIAVSTKKEIESWGPWSVKDGCHHVQPGIDVLNSMVAFRLHIDESSEESGCLRVIPESHKLGVMSQCEIDNYVQGATPFQCVAKTNSALVMRPHILHASSKASKPTSRRVLHVEYSSYTLPKGLEWA
jgi:ectoine hydroxylase-related dioxygenase (phytanoyl-CoA dioxygenase family)